MIEYIISYAIKAVIIYWFYNWVNNKSFDQLGLILCIIAVWWIIDNIISPFFNQEEREAYFQKLFSIDILNLCLRIYYIIAGAGMYFLYSYWKDLDAAWKKIVTLGGYMLLYNRLYFAILNMNNKELSEGFCACSL